MVTPATVSVVVPTLNEEERILPALRSARAAFGAAVDLVVVDGGSTDRTRERAARAATVLESRPGRGIQLDVGARASTGDILVFLHADTRLEPGSGARVREALRRPGVVGGCFRFTVNGGKALPLRYRLLQAAVDLRTRGFRTATGDQAIFVSRPAYEAAGGVPDQPLFEDVAFVSRLKRVGRFHPIPAEARTSRRRWEEEGFWPTVARHLALRGAYAVGVTPARLARWYPPLGGPGGDEERVIAPRRG